METESAPSNNSSTDANPAFSSIFGPGGRKRGMEDSDEIALKRPRQNGKISPTLAWEVLVTKNSMGETLILQEMVV